MTKDSLEQLLLVDFPNDPGQVSQQQREMYESNSEYRDKVQHLWDILKTDPRPTGLKNAGYGYLVQKYYQIRAWSDGKNRPPMSPEFKDLIYFVRYVGPKLHQDHHLDRINPNVGYTINNLRWADNETKASNKRKGRYHEVMGSRLTDKGLSILLKKKDVAYSADAIKHYRQYWQKQGKSLFEITEQIFKNYDLPYGHSDDPVENADFPEQYRTQMSKAYRDQRHKNESRIEFGIRWLIDQAVYAESVATPLPNDLTKLHLLRLAVRFRAHAQGERKRLDGLRHKKAEQLLAQFPEPPTPPPPPQHEWKPFVPPTRTAVPVQVHEKHIISPEEWLELMAEFAPKP